MYIFMYIYMYVYIYMYMYVLYTHTHTHTYNTVYNELSCTIVGADKSRDLKLARWTQKIRWCAFKSKSESLRSKRANDINSSVKAGKLKIQYEMMFHLDPKAGKKLASQLEGSQAERISPYS